MSQSGVAYQQDTISVAIHGIHGEIVIREQLAQRIPNGTCYPDLSPQRPPLLMTLHADSLAQTSVEDGAARDWLVASGKHTARSETHPDLNVMITSPRQPDGMAWAAGTRSLGTERAHKVWQDLHQASLRADWEQVRTKEQPPAAVIDLRLHEAQARHVFVTLDEGLLNLGLDPTVSHTTFIIGPREAQCYADLYLKAHGAFRVVPNYSVNRGLYYWMRLWNLAPSFQSAWPHAVFARDHLPHGVEIENFMHALYARLIGMMQAHDRIGWLRYCPATNDNRDEMLNQLNYFIVLATGVFDSIAWLAVYRFGMPIPQQRTDRMGITVRAKRKSGKDFLANLAALPDASDLASYLADADRQVKIELFYEPRDSIQHRLVLTGAHQRTGQYTSDCIVAFLDPDAARDIYAIDHHEPAGLPYTTWPVSPWPFSTWGVLYPAEESEQPMLEPFRFTATALRFVLSFVDGALEQFDFARWISVRPDVKGAADDAIATGRERNCPDFAIPYP